MVMCSGCLLRLVSQVVVPCFFVSSQHLLEHGVELLHFILFVLKSCILSFFNYLQLSLGVPLPMTELFSQIPGRCHLGYEGGCRG